VITGGTAVPVPEEINYGFVRNETLGVDYGSITAALAAPALADGHVIFAPQGWYNEQFSIPRDGIDLRGAGPSLTVIDKENGGKADALNTGTNASRYGPFRGVEAASVLERVCPLRCR